ncbi:uncharacterized protein LOC104907198 isoform X2 [Beta vulgaris subsp. vulgaris]|uniref:uncharacterized protein LOC104907198 isoform X2 n=1 Tax=Beta vulgaris subsp. vulgaris TaxID=3555 RepID=UPI0020369D5F|nr:uncharacterized protein LOC104907198 isoform X2 [Beta vulgaris subsp. vulgaris]
MGVSSLQFKWLYFHPDNMSAEEKLKLELKRIRDEFKMHESDCGSTRVQNAESDDANDDFTAGKETYDLREIKRVDHIEKETHYMTELLLELPRE